MKGHGQRGFALVGAIFVLVVLAFLGTVMVRVSGVQNRTMLLSLQGAQVYHAARGGLEWGVSRALATGNCTGFAAPAGTTFSIEGYDVNVSCRSDAVVEGGVNLTVFRIAARAENGVFGARPDYVSRRLEATVTSAAP